MNYARVGQFVPSVHESKVEKAHGGAHGGCMLDGWMDGRMGGSGQALGPGTRESISLPEGGDGEQ